MQEENSTAGTETPPFKACTSCTAVWPTREDFLADPGVELVGYQAHFEDLQAGLLLFNHTCHTTMALEVGDFQDLYKGPIFREHIRGQPDCPDFCVHQSNLRPCPAHCECAFVRAILQIIRNWKKR